MQAIILTADGVEDWELMYPYYRIREENISQSARVRLALEIEGRREYWETEVRFREIGGMGQEEGHMEDAGTNTQP